MDRIPLETGFFTCFQYMTFFGTNGSGTPDFGNSQEQTMTDYLVMIGCAQGMGPRNGMRVFLSDKLSYKP